MDFKGVSAILNKYGEQIANALYVLGDPPGQHHEAAEQDHEVQVPGDGPLPFARSASRAAR